MTTQTTAPVPASWREIPEGAVDLRLVVVDMDGTLLLPSGEVPAAFWPVLERLEERGIAFVPASGRQLATLRAGFGPHGVTSFVAENGTVVVREDEIVATTALETAVAREAILAAREAGAGRPLGIVRCGVHGACVEQADEEFLQVAGQYYHQLTVVEDLLAVQDEVIKVAVHDAIDAAPTAEAVFARFAPAQQVVVSGKHWIDVMPATADKGRGVRALQEALGVTAAQTAVFGDYLNDLPMFPVAEHSFAMADAHPDVAAAARYGAPSNADAGVVQVLEHLLGDASVPSGRMRG
ncbi:Cof-type HAD-IIB family hydrolase [Brachybacterium phenoliresistens]|uniref:Cof-type HAD-IIB family hydrolase n=1 Tax=Brachybacterium phenoliresistens TaxID=396014 RepID=UPI0004AEB278|nr:HAD family hydrolase [Brachybacterium phenoliresistens]